LPISVFGRFGAVFGPRSAPEPCPADSVRNPLYGSVQKPLPLGPRPGFCSIPRQKPFDLRPRCCSIPTERSLGPAPRAQGPSHRYGTAPWPQITWFLGAMEQNHSRGPRRGCFWTDPYRSGLIFFGEHVWVFLSGAVDRPGRSGPFRVIPKALRFCATQPSLKSAQITYGRSSMLEGLGGFGVAPGGPCKQVGGKVWVLEGSLARDSRPDFLFGFSADTDPRDPPRSPGPSPHINFVRKISPADQLHTWVFNV